MGEGVTYVTSSLIGWNCLHVIWYDEWEVFFLTGGPHPPGTPAGPSGPTDPWAPFFPAAPIEPVCPWIPLGPASPPGPVTPVTPVAPGFPCCPGCPVGPSSPWSPAGPFGPFMGVSWHWPEENKKTRKKYTIDGFSGLLLTQRWYISQWLWGSFQDTLMRFYISELMNINTRIKCMCKIFYVEFQRFPLKFHTKYLTHTRKGMIYNHEILWALWFKSSYVFLNPPPPPPPPLGGGIWSYWSSV